MKYYPLGTKIGQYEVVSAPMKGGMGEVYFCLDQENADRPVALKTFRYELLSNRDARDRFLKEGSAWVDLGVHTHIVRCFSVEYIDPAAFLVLELITKESHLVDASLRSWMIAGRPMLVRQALVFANQVARGMQYAASRIPGFVHRDLKPENILVGADKLPNADVNRLRVTDFGLVKTVTDPSVLSPVENKMNSQNTRGAGTPLYMAPEQWKGEPVGSFTDIYAFGCILYEMLSGKYAARGTSPQDWMRSHCEGNLQDLPVFLPSEVSDLIAVCLAFDVKSRPGSWEILLQKLEQAYASLHVGDLPPEVTPEELQQVDGVVTGWSYNSIGLAYKDLGNAQDSIRYFEKAHAIGNAQHDLQLSGAAINNIGEARRDLGDAGPALKYFEKYLALSREINSEYGQGLALGNMGLANVDLGNFQEAIRYYEKSLTIFRRTSNQRDELVTLENLGSAYLYIGEIQTAIDYYEKALIDSRNLSDRRAEETVLGNLGVAFASQGDKHKAIGYYEQQLAISREIGDRHEEASTLGNLGAAYFDLGDLQRAFQYYKEDLKIAREIGDKKGIAIMLFNFAWAHAQSNETEKALPYVLEAVEIWKEISSPFLQRGLDLLSQLQATPKKTGILGRFFGRKR